MKTVNWIFALFNVKPVIIDGALCVIIAMLGFTESSMSNEEAYKYWNPFILYFSKWGVGILSAGFISLNFFRSKSYSDHRKSVDDAQNNKVIQTETQVTQTTNETKVSNPTPLPITTG